MNRSFCIDETEVGRLFNVTFYRRVTRGDRATYFGIRAGEYQGPQVDGYLLQQAIAGNAEAVIVIARVVEEFYG